MIRSKINRLFLSQIYYKIKHAFLLKKNKKLEELINNGYCILENKISKDIVYKFKEKYCNYENYNFVNKRNKIEFKDLKLIFNEILKLNVLQIINEYLGQNIYSYDNSILTVGNFESKKGSWQPHHDGKGRRLKIYIWLDKKNFLTHPLSYLRSSNKKLFIWNSYSQTRKNDLNAIQMDKIYCDLGNIIIFDTHGIHSGFKETKIPRSVIELTFESFGFTNRIYDKIKKDKAEIERLDAINLKKLINLL